MVDTTQHSAIGTPGRRRNGRLQACEPCRKRKLSCDHVYPSCGRCRARDRADGCVYIASQSQVSGSRKTVPRRAREVLPERRRDNEGPTLSTSRGAAPSTNTTTDAREPRGVSTEKSPGYLGFTSFSAVFQETQNSLSLVQGGSIVSSIDAPGADTATTTTLTPRTLETAIAIIRLIPSADDVLPIFLRYAHPNDGWIRLAAKRLVERLHPAFPELRSKNNDDLAAVAKIFSTNTARSWAEENEPDAERWIASLCGRSMRWECLGILFTYWGLEALANNRPAVVDDGADARRITLVFKEAAQGCAELCKMCAPNSLLLYLMHKIGIMESILCGDASPSFWRYCGENIATATYLGIHALSQEVHYVPTAASEAKRRLISQIFVIDKIAASFSGRPPLLSRKYMLTPLPLDLSDETLLADAATMAREVAALDGRGWNQRNECHSATIVRARRLLMTVKDKIMEVALGHPGSTPIEALLELKGRQYSLFSEYPCGLRYQTADLRNLSLPGPTLYTRLVIYLEHLQNLFFIARLLVQRGHDSHADLLRVSFEMVSTTLIFWTHMDRLAGVHADCEWLVMAYAAPAAGVLCNALLPTQHMAVVPSVTKSEMVQQLSLLIGFLDWVGPSAPNSDLCISCKAVIQHVLDLAINGPPVTSSATHEPDEVADLNFDLGMDIGGFFNFDLLDTFDWLRADSSQQSQ